MRRRRIGCAKPGMRKAVFHFKEPSARLEVTWRPSNIDERERRLSQVVAYELFAADGAPLCASVERLTLWWFSDFELESSARNAGLQCERTLTGFGSEGGDQRIYMLRKPS